MPNVWLRKIYLEQGTAATCLSISPPPPAFAVSASIIQIIFDFCLTHFFVCSRQIFIIAIFYFVTGNSKAQFNTHEYLIQWGGGRLKGEKSR